MLSERHPWFVLSAFLFPLSAVRSTPELTLDDLKKLEIICFVPSYLPKGFRLQRVDITYDEPGPDEPKRLFPLYSIVYSNDPRQGATFSIESAREGIGDRNIMEEENTEETAIQSPFGPMYLIYWPKGKNGRKDEIKANWVSDANMNAETTKNPESHPILGRYHGFSATGITPAEFSKIVQSLHPIRDEKAAASAAPQNSALKIHPKVFSMINCWISDSESPVVTEINLDAAEKNGNEFNQDGLKQDGEWLQCPASNTGRFMRYRVLESKGNHYKVEFQENGGGTLTTASIIEFGIEKRNIQRNGKPVTIFERFACRPTIRNKRRPSQMATKKALMPKKVIWLGVLLVTALCVARAQTQAPAKKKEIQITWLGHAAFELVSPGGTDILVDPFLTKNPATPAEFKDLSRYQPNFILVTHSHGDHLGDAIELAKMSKAKIVSVYMPEPFKKGELPRELIEGVNVGDHLTLGDVKVHVVPAMHSSEPSGRPVGFVVEFPDGRSVYHQGDTWIFGDMALIQEFYHPNIILMPVGAVADGQSPRMAWIAVTRYFKPQIVIPMHYGALPGSSTEADLRAVFGKDPRVIFMKPGETKKF